LRADHSLQFSSRPPSSRAFWLDTEKSTRVRCEADVVMTSVTKAALDLGSPVGVKLQREGCDCPSSANIRAPKSCTGERDSFLSIRR